jgi:hypothetical protein
MFIKDKIPEKGLLGLFKNTTQLIDAIGKVRSLNVHAKNLEAYTPFPSHEIDHALGLKRSFIPYLTLLFGLSGAALLFLFQVWTSAIDWPINVGGKPFISWPAFIPITFEGGILFGGVLTVITLFLVLRLPITTPPLDERLTNDCFGLYINDQDPNYKIDEVKKVLTECGAIEVKH